MKAPDQFPFEPHEALGINQFYIRPDEIEQKATATRYSVFEKNTELYRRGIMQLNGYRYWTAWIEL